MACPRRVAQDVEGLEHGVNKAALHPFKEEVYELVDRLLRELVTIFPDEYLHLGGDEVDGDCWLSDPEVMAWGAPSCGSNPRPDWPVAGDSAAHAFRRHRGGSAAAGANVEAAAAGSATCRDPPPPPATSRDLPLTSHDLQ